MKLNYNNISNAIEQGMFYGLCVFALAMILKLILIIFFL